MTSKLKSGNFPEGEFSKMHSEIDLTEGCTPNIVKRRYLTYLLFGTAFIWFLNMLPR